jgi:hypothetical protein
MIDQIEIAEMLKKKPNGNLHHREGQTLEFKEQFNFAGLVDYFRDFAAFSNNKGGHLIFGVTDSPRKATGLSKNSEEQFEKIDPEKISEYLLGIFSGEIDWQQELIVIDGLNFGVFKIIENQTKPIIAKKDEGKDQYIKNGEIYYRYAGRTQKIRFPELEVIINKRIENNNSSWMDLVTKIGKAGPQNAAILDTEKGLIEKGENQVMVIDENLVKKLTFIKKGEFKEEKGAKTLQLIGDITPVDQVDVIKKVKEDLIKRYPLTSTQVADKVKDSQPSCSKNEVWRIMRENDLKQNFDYSAYNFRSKGHEDDYNETGIIPSGTTSIFKDSAVEFIANIWKQEQENGK